MEDKITRFLRESNAIEDVWDEESLKDALKAWNYVSKLKKLSCEAILKTHKILMEHQPILDKEKGIFRRVPVWIGGREGKPWYAVPELMAQLCENSKDHTDWEDIKQDHIMFEKIHPFVDGNGRSGRIFMNWQRQHAGLEILIVEEAKKWDYYKWFDPSMHP